LNRKYNRTLFASDEASSRAKYNFGTLGLDVVFLANLCFLIYANLFASVRGMPKGGVASLLAIGHFLSCTIAGVAFLLGMELLPDPRRGIAGDAINWCPAVFFIFGVVHLPPDLGDAVPAAK
jgi:hypothetical protein